MRDNEYLKLGVNSHKKGINFFKNLIKPMFNHAFVDIFNDPNNTHGIILHVDGAGSKPIVAYLYYKETNETKWFRGLSQDVIAMNINDVITVGASPILFADYIALNSFRIPRLKVLKELSKGFEETINILNSMNKKELLIFSGGETADLPDQVRTLDIIGALFAKVNLSQVIDGSKISKDDIIIGFRSGGKAIYEKDENSGIMCNGLTLARHVLLNSEYKEKYPEIYENISSKKYYGRYKIDKYIDELNMTIGEALLSPTRLYTPIINEILEHCYDDIKGMVHNTGGGLTKILRIGKGLRYIKNNLPQPEPIFLLIQHEGKIKWREMYEVFNMGIGFEIITNRNCTDKIIDIAEKHGINAYIIGRVEKTKSTLNEVIIKSIFGKFIYRRSIG
ncbi:MAG: AIR synthase related protein [Thermoprotei archaeon]|jgi:phosphoribosylformylglycinamidine cyclo-ligase